MTSKLLRKIFEPESTKIPASPKHLDDKLANVSRESKEENQEHLNRYYAVAELFGNAEVVRFAGVFPSNHLDEDLLTEVRQTVLQGLVDSAYTERDVVVTFITKLEC